MARKKKEELLKIESTSSNDNILLQSKVDTESIKNELKDYVDERVNQVFFDELEKTNRKLIREKSRRILWKNIFIVILLLIIGFLTYLLYTNNYFDKFFNRDTPTEEKEEKKEEEEKKETTPSPTPSPTITPKVPTREELIKEYGDLLDNYYVTDSSIYLVDFYDGKLTDDIKKYITLNAFDFSSFDKEEDYQIIKESAFKTMYEKLFNDEYKSESFSYDDNKIRYVKAMEAYMTTTLLVREDSDIKREIKDIKVDGNEIIITTIEGVLKDNKLYNIISNEEITDYKEDSIIKYESKLNKLVYTFKNNKLINLSK